MPKRRAKKSDHLVAPDKEKDVCLSVTAQLNHKLMPLDRGERYEDPDDRGQEKQDDEAPTLNRRFDLLRRNLLLVRHDALALG